MKLLHPITLEKLGEVGNPALYGYYVGDIVSIRKSSREIQNAVMCESEGEFFPFGWRYKSILMLEKENDMKLLNSHNQISNDLLKICKWKLYLSD